MKKIIFSLLLTLIFFHIPNVNAEECVNLFTNEEPTFYGAEYQYYWDYRENGKQFSPVYEVGETYTFWINDGTLPFSDYLNENVKMSYFSFGNGFASLDDFTLTFFTFTATKSTGRLFIYANGTASITLTYQPLNENFNEFWLVKGTEVCTPVVEPEEPEVPIEPDEPIIADTTLDEFYSLYVSKLQFLFQYAVENKFILGFIAIILLFIVLEIVLSLFRKSGYR